MHTIRNRHTFTVFTFNLGFDTTLLSLVAVLNSAYKV